MGRAVNSAGIFGPDHFKTRSAAAEGFRVLSLLLAESAPLVFGLANARLLLNGRMVENREPMVRALEARLNALRIHGFSLLSGLTEDDYRQLVVLLATTRAGEFETELKRSPIPHVQAASGIWTNVPEGAEVTSPREKPKEATAEKDATRGVLRLDSDAEVAATLLDRPKPFSPWEIEGAAVEYVQALRTLDRARQRLRRILESGDAHALAHALAKAGLPASEIRRLLAHRETS